MSIVQNDSSQTAIPQKLYCLCLTENIFNNPEIKKMATDMNIELLEICRKDLFVNPNLDGSGGVDLARYYVENQMGNGMKIILDKVTQYIEAAVNKQDKQDIKMQCS